MRSIALRITVSMLVMLGVASGFGQTNPPVARQQTTHVIPRSAPSNARADSAPLKRLIEKEVETSLKARDGFMESRRWLFDILLVVIGVAATVIGIAYPLYRAYLDKALKQVRVKLGEVKMKLREVEDIREAAEKLQTKAEKQRKKAEVYLEELTKMREEALEHTSEIKLAIGYIRTSQLQRPQLESFIDASSTPAEWLRNRIQQLKALDTRAPEMEQLIRAFEWQLSEDFVQAQTILGDLYKNRLGTFGGDLRSYIAYYYGSNLLRESMTEDDTDKLDEAISVLRHAVEMNANDGRLYNNLGNALYVKRLYDEALEMLLKAKELFLNSSRNHHQLKSEACENIGNTLYHLGRYEEAKKSFRQGIEYQATIESYGGYLDVCLAFDPDTADYHSLLRETPYAPKDPTDGEALLLRIFDQIASIRDGAEGILPDNAADIRLFWSFELMLETMQSNPNISASQYINIQKLITAISGS